MQVNTIDTALSADVGLAQQGDREAFTRLVTAAGNTVNSIALSITKDLDSAADVTQSVFIKVWQEIGQLKETNSFLPWVRQITRYTALNQLRADKTTSKLSSQQADELLANLVSETPAEDISLIKHQQNQLILHLLEQLEDESREIVLLFYREHQDSKAVAHLLGLSADNVRKKLQRVREMLKSQVLEQYGKVIFSVAPVGVTSIVSIACVTIAPPATAAVTTKLAASQTGWLAKLSVVLSGALLGAAFAVVANLIQYNVVIKKVIEAHIKDALKRVRNITTACIGVSAVVMILGYEFTQGWLVPVLSFCGLIISLFWGKQRVQSLTRHYHLAKPRKQQLKDTITCYLGLLTGMLGGGSAMLYGLYLSGRLSQAW